MPGPDRASRFAALVSVLLPKKGRCVGHHPHLRSNPIIAELGETEQDSLDFFRQRRERFSKAENGRTLIARPILDGRKPLFDKQ